MLTILVKRSVAVYAMLGDIFIFLSPMSNKEKKQDRGGSEYNMKEQYILQKISFHYHPY
jgi:hypothetical protein